MDARNEKDNLHIFPKSYPYNPKFWLCLAVILLFGVAAYFSFQEAHVLKRDLSVSLYHIIKFTLPNEQGKLLLYVFFLVSLFFVGVGFFLLYRKFNEKRELFLTRTSLSLIKNGEIVKEMAIQDIDSISLFNNYGTHILTLKDSNKKKMTVTTSLLPSKKDFDDIVDAMSMLVYERDIQKKKH